MIDQGHSTITRITPAARRSGFACKQRIMKAVNEFFDVKIKE
jgi:hypothetical protein